MCVCIYIYMYPYIYVFDAVDKDFSCSTPKAQATKPSLYECVLVSFQFQFPLSLLLCTNILDFYVLTLLNSATLLAFPVDSVSKGFFLPIESAGPCFSLCLCAPAGCQGEQEC